MAEELELDLFGGDDGDVIAAPTGDDEQRRNDEIYKKWFRRGDKSGFVSLRGWLEKGKVAVDIGEAGEGGLQGATMVWTNALPLMTYLRAVSNGQGTVLFPANERARVGPESFVYYGGGQTKEGRDISRILKITYWTEGDPSGFAWKTGHFPATRTRTGAYVPDMSAPIQSNLIKVNRPEMAEIALSLELALHAHAAGQDFGAVLNSLRGGK